MKLEESRLAVIGAGNMGTAIARGLVESGKLPAHAVTVTCRRPDRAQRVAEELGGCRWAARNPEAAADAHIVLLAVKPQIMERVLTEVGPSCADKLVISVAAGLDTERLEAWAGGRVRMLRAMPNTPATIGAAATAVAAGFHATEADLELGLQIFGAIGRAVRVDEEHLDAVTGLSGSGPAYVFLILEAFADAGVKVGLSREVAQELAAQTLLGSALMVQKTGEHPGRLKDQVTSPGGTAIAGLHALEGGRMRTVIMDAVEAAARRAAELGAKR